MALYQIDWGKRAPYTPNPDGYYYWSSTYYLDSDDFASLAALRARVYSFERTSQLTISQQTWLFQKTPPGRGNVAATIYQFHQPGLVPAGTTGYSLLNIARWTLYSNTGRQSYKMCRMPLRGEDMDGMLLSATGYARQQAQAAQFLTGGLFRNRYGEPIAMVKVSPYLHMWQLRHGTKRRTRPVIA